MASSPAQGLLVHMMVGINMKPISAGDLWTCAQTSWSEARNQGSDGIAAVIHVMQNRGLYHQRWMGLSLSDICKAPWQFSCWNIGDPNRVKMMQITMGDPIFVTCLELAVAVLSNKHASNVGKSCHYFVKDMPHPPKWADGKTPFITIGAHSFYENIV